MASTNSQILSKLERIEQLDDRIKGLEKDVKSVLKLLRAMKRTQDDPTGEKAEARQKNSGFNRPIKITPELAKFLGVKDETPMSCRSDVTAAVNKYINEKSLKDPADKRKIICDKTLSKLLDPGDEEVTFLSIQKFLNRHYIKEPAA